MTFRTRLFVVVLLAVLIPMVALALFVRNEMTKRLTAQYERRVESLVSVIEEDLAQQSAAIGASLSVIRRAILDDNRFRRAAVNREMSERRYLLDYAGDVMRLAGLSMLQIQDNAGRILSSGHFRNEYDRLEPGLSGLLSKAPGGMALVEARAPDGPFLALARVDSLDMGGKRFFVVAGVKVEERFLARLSREDLITVKLIHPGGVLTPSPAADRSEAAGASTTAAVPPEEEIVGVLGVPIVDASTARINTATFHVTHEMTEAKALRRSIDRWFLAAVVVTCLLAVLLVTWLASRISRPLVELADKTSRIDLDRLDIDFSSRRKDEIGALSRLLGAMTGRLRASAVRIKDAERRATLGEMARQINHDIKNGLTPIRNVFRHLAELSRDNPAQLPEVFKERQQTIDSSVSYLENLATNYARLSPRNAQGARQSCAVNDVVKRVLADLGGPGPIDFRRNLTDGAAVFADPLSVRRILENLVNNAIDSLHDGPGSVTVSTKIVTGDQGRSIVRLTVADTGSGMNEAQRSCVFDDFYTTKDQGTGLGLSIVRRLVMDMDGSVRVESEVGKGSVFVVDLPAVHHD